jgi:hypothetical protein
MTRLIDAQIRAYCEEHGLRFSPWEVEPADADSGPSPWPAGTGGFESWPLAQKMRRKIVAELARHNARGTA